VAKIVVRLDDIHPRMRWEKFSRFCLRLEAAGVTGLLGVIPACEDPSISHEDPKRDFWDQLRVFRARGWTIAQHGYRHVYDSQAPNYLGRASRSEFAGHDYETQAGRIARGAKILSEEGVGSDIFMPPGHNFD
jgi:predicted deacetylase